MVYGAWAWYIKYGYGAYWLWYVGYTIMFGAWPWYMGHGSLCSLPVVSELPVEVLKTQLGALKLLSR